jgi:hypothetical protein
VQLCEAKAHRVRSCCAWQILPIVEAFVFVAEFEIRQLGTNVDGKYKSSLLILLLNL